MILKIKKNYSISMSFNSFYNNTIVNVYRYKTMTFIMSFYYLNIDGATLFKNT